MYGTYLGPMGPGAFFCGGYGGVEGEESCCSEASAMMGKEGLGVPRTVVWREGARE